MSYAIYSRMKVARDYRETAIGALKQLKEIQLANGATGVRQGILMTGSGVNLFMKIQFYENMAALENGWEASRKSPIINQTLASGKFEFTGRSILRDLVLIGTPSLDQKYVVLTNGKAESPVEDEVKELGNIFLENGGISGRLLKFVMGDQADGQTYSFGMGYPSLSSVQSAYDAIPAEFAAKFYKLVSVQRRQIIRLF